MRCNEDSIHMASYLDIAFSDFCLPLLSLHVVMQLANA